ncbi:MAG: hypothetical protein M3514_00540 [Actinomycetota bacterium]|nr:hypothetical protein [Actinomycetota bacterium]
MVFRRLRDIFSGPDRPTDEPSPLYGLEDEERARIGTEEDPLRNFEAAMQRNEEAELAVSNGDTERAINLYEISIREKFVGSHPYERLASIYESRHNPTEALRVCEAFTDLAASGKMPRGAQRSADRKLPEFEARIQRCRRSLDEGR